ncbi:hypothetical protein JCM10213_008486 [Rhodosporidiobolus nylandii]
MPGLSGYSHSTHTASSTLRDTYSRSPSRVPSVASNASASVNNAARQVRWGSDEVFNHAQPRVRGAEAGDGEVEASEADEDGTDSGSVLAIASMKGKLGCCYFEPTSQKLFFVEDQPDSSNWDLTHLILEQLLPTTVLTSSSADADFLTVLDSALSTLPVSAPSAASTASTGDTSDPAVRLEFRPAREFYSGQGKLALSQLHITEGGWYAEDELSQTVGEDNTEEEFGDGAPGDAYDFGRRRKRRKIAGATVEGDRLRRNRELRLEAFLNGLNASPITLGCAGALLGFISRARTSAGDLDAGDFEVTGLELLRLDKVMHINSDALASLQIFSDESHASAHSNATKEGLSLFGIVNLARTPLGRLLMKQWFLRPSLELDVIENRHLAVECFLRSENQHVVDAIQSQFRFVKNTPRVLKSLASGRGGLKDWQTIWQALYGSIMVRDAALNLVHRREVEVVDKVLSSFDALEFKELGSTIADIIDWEESALQNGRVCVRPGVNSDLDEWRRKLAGLPSLLSKVADGISSTLPPTLGVAELSLVYFPQLGYLITIPYEPEAADAGKYGEVGWDFQFVTEMRAYFKNDKCCDMDRHLGDLHSFVADKEIEIIHALLTHLLRLGPQLSAVTAALSELDCLIAFAEASRLYDWNRPEMVEGARCEIINGRHPLAELCVESFVRNSTSLMGGQGRLVNPDEDEKPDIALLDASAAPGDAHGHVKEEEGGGRGKSMLIVTGANFSGKSVYLKQVALIVFLAHIGCFVPADSAIIGLTDRILTRVSTRESVTRGASAFMIDLQQVSFLLRNATPSSLILLDEFGKGTEADDGAGLFCGVIEHLVNLGANAPRTLVATHFQHVFLNGLLSRRLPGVELAHMEVLIADEGDPKTGKEGGTEALTYLYRLAPGLTISSHAASCALLFGLPTSVVERASYITHLLSTFSLDTLHSEQLTEKEKKEVREGEEVGRRFLEWDLDETGECETEELRRRLGEVLGVVEEGEE